MSIVFINDHPFVVDESNCVYTTGTLDSEVWKRFTDNFGKLVVIGRGRKVAGKISTLKLSSSMDVEFDLFYQIKGGLDYFKYKRQIIDKLTPYIQKAEYIVLRLPSSLGVIAAEICKKHAKKYLVELVGCPFDSLWYYGNIASKIMAPINAHNNRKAVANASAVVYVTKEYLQKRYPNKGDIINASNVIVDKFPVDVCEKHMNFLTRETSQRFMGMIGNIELPYKGYETLFKALSTVHDNYKLIIVGGGNPIWITSLMEKYGLVDKVELKGRINEREKIFEFLDQLDIYIQPSWTEGLPRGVIEAMSRACPVIASTAGGIPELVSADKLYAPKDYNALNKLIKSHLNNTIELQKMANSNYNKAGEYSFGHINERRYVFFKKIKNQIKN